MDIIDRYLRTFRSENTKKTYRCSINKFFKVIKADPKTYLDEERDYEEDVIKLWESLKGRPPKTVSTTMSAVKGFLKKYKILRNAEIWEELDRRTHGNRARTMDEVPTPQQLKEILRYGTLKDHALFLMVSSSGMRVGEALQLLPEDIDMSHIPTKVIIRGEYTKTGNKRLTFISNEATEALKAWLKQREGYIEGAVKKTNFGTEKAADDPRIFPFVYNTARKSWIRMITKAGYDEKDLETGRYKYHVHSLRKFFRSRLTLKVPVDIVEALMGHEGYLTGVYRRYTTEQLAEYYQKGMEELIVIQTPLDTSAINEQLQRLKSDNLQLRTDLNRVMDMLMSSNSMYKDDDGFLSGTVRWKTYEDGSKQILEFDKEARGFIPVGRRIPAEEVKSPDWQIIEIKEVENYAKSLRRRGML